MCDSQILASVQAACVGAAQIVLAIGFAYERAIWADQWPRAMAHVLQAAEANGARLIFVDNLYMYGPQTVPLVETLPLSPFGTKPAVRAAITRQWMFPPPNKISRAGTITMSWFGQASFKALAAWASKPGSNSGTISAPLHM